MQSADARIEPFQVNDVALGNSPERLEPTGAMSRKHEVSRLSQTGSCE